MSERIPLEECVEYMHKRHSDEVEDGEDPRLTEVLGDTLLHVGELKQKKAHLQADVDAALKQVGELEFSIEAQLRTIQEQSDTLMNREKLVDELKEEREQLRTTNEPIVSPDEEPETPAEEPSDADLLLQVSDAMQGYGLNLVRGSANENQILLGGGFIKVGWALRGRKGFDDGMDWLAGNV